MPKSIPEKLRARGGKATAPERPLKLVAPPKITLAKGPKLSQRQLAREAED